MLSNEYKNMFFFIFNLFIFYFLIFKFFFLFLQLMQVFEIISLRTYFSFNNINKGKERFSKSKISEKPSPPSFPPSSSSSYFEEVVTETEM